MVDEQELGEGSKEGANEPSNEGNNDPSNKLTSVGGSRWRAWLVIGLVCTVGIIVNLPYQYQAVSSNVLRSPQLPFDLGRNSEDAEPIVDPVLAGWPSNFRIAHRFADADHEVRYKWLNLFTNVLLWCIVVAFFVWGTRPKPKKKGVSLSDLLILVALIAGVMGYWQFRLRQTEADGQAAKQLSDSGVVVRQAFVPKIIKPHLPDFATKLWARITIVDIQNPTPSQVDTICRLGHLRSLRIAGGDGDLTPLSRLPSMPYLQDLRVAGKELNAETVLAISDCKLLTQLNISHTNCGPRTPVQLAKLPRLKRLMALETLIPYNAWDQNPIKEQIVQLNLTHPPTGNEGELTFKDWPRLKSLTLRSLDGFINPNRFRITLHDMPELDLFEIDNFQYVDLNLQRLPKLADVGKTIANYNRRLANDEVVSGSVWAGKMVIKDMPALTNFWLYILGFESIEIENCPALEHFVGSSLAYPGEGDSYYQTDVADTPTEKTQKLIDSLAKTENVKVIGIHGVDLANIELSSLANNKWLTGLEFKSCIIPPEMAKNFAEIPLETLNLSKAKIESGKMVEIPDSLRQVYIDPQVTAIRFENKPELSSLFFDQHRQPRITALRLVDLPKFESPMVLAPGAVYLHVENTPALKGLAFLPIGRDITIKGVEGLEWFVGGSHLLKDEHVSEVLKAKELRHVTFAYSSASGDSFDGLFQLDSLVKALVPGAPLKDQMISDWEIPKSMNALDIRDCGLSTKSIAKIIHRGNWQSLYLAGNEIDPEDLVGLSKSPELTELDLSGADIPSGLFTTVLKDCERLEKLALSGCKLKNVSIAGIKRFPLRELHLYGAEADWNEVQKIVAANSGLKIGIGPTDATVQMVTMLTQAKRLVRRQSVYESFYTEPSFLGYDARGVPAFQDPDKIKGPDQFEMPNWLPEFFDLESQSNSENVFQGVLPGLRVISRGSVKKKVAPKEQTNDQKQKD